MGADTGEDDQQHNVDKDQNSNDSNVDAVVPRGTSAAAAREPSLDLKNLRHRCNRIPVWTTVMRTSMGPVQRHFQHAKLAHGDQKCADKEAGCKPKALIP